MPEATGVASGVRPPGGGRMRCLLLGATGRTGGRVLTELLDRGVAVRALARARGGASAAARLRPATSGHPGLEVVEAEVASLGAAELRAHLAGCDAVVCCLGPNVGLRGVFGPPYDLVAGTVERLIDAADALRPEVPIRLVLMSSVSVNRPSRGDARRRAVERAFLWLLRCLLPPARDNQRAADALVRRVGPRHPTFAWVAVRPDTLVAGENGAYRTHEALVTSIFRADRTRIADVAHFMAELVTDLATWERWRGQMPVVVSETAGASS